MMGGALLRWRWAILLAVLVVAGLTLAFWPQFKTADIAQVSRGPMELGITDDGMTQAEEFYVVAAPVTGYLTRIELEPGDQVERGSLITTMRGMPSSPLDPRTGQSLRSALAAARSAEAGTTAALSQAQRDLARATALAQRGFLPRAQLEAARTRVAEAEAALGQARGEVAQIMAQLAPSGARTGSSRIAVRAPVRGTILSVITESEGAVAEGTPLVTIGDPRQIEVVVDLLSREAVRVKVGDPVRIEQWGGSEPLAGRVQRIEPFGRLKVSALGIEEQRVNVIIAFDPASRAAGERLGHGYQVDATIIFWQQDDVLRVPIGALFRGKTGDWQVLVLANGRVALRRVRVGKINDEWGEVIEGLRAGEKVVLNPSPQLVEGTRVTAR